MDTATRRWAFWALVAAAVGLSWALRFVMDDAFISARYAENLLAGHGLVFNPGERVEGYTNFTWVLLMAGGMALGADVVDLVIGLGPLLCLGTLLVSARLARHVVGRDLAPLVVVILLGSNATFAAFATGGLETMLCALLITAVFTLALRPGDVGRRRAAAVSALAALAVMTRPDAFLPAGLACLALLWRVRPDRRRIAATIVPGALITGAWLAFKLAYYGAILPNTFVAKTGSDGLLSAGVDYLWAFVRSYTLWPALLLVAGALVARRSLAILATTLAVAVTWVYLAGVGGDHMEFRFLVPTLPLLMVAVTWGLWQLPWPAARAALVALLLWGSWDHARTFDGDQGIASVAQLQSYLADPGHDWVGVGKALGAALPESDALIAVTAAGAVPYYSRLPTLDMLGLCDPWVARNGTDVDIGAERLRVAPFDYLVERDTNLVVAQPWIRPARPQAPAYPFRALIGLQFLVDASPALIPPRASMVEAPLPGDRVLTMLYLTPHPDIEAAISAGGWRRVPLIRPGQALRSRPVPPPGGRTRRPERTPGSG